MAMQSSPSNNSASIFTCALNPQYTFDIERSRYVSHWGISVFILGLNSISSVISTVVNLLIVLGIVTSRRRRTPTFILLCNLAFTDFVIGVAMGPIITASLVLGDYKQVCASFKAYSYLGLFLGSSSLYTLTSISFDRYLSIQMRTKYQTIVTNKRAYKTIAIVWLVSLLGPMFMSFISKWSVAVLICCVQVLCLIIIVDCYRLSFDEINRRQKEVKVSIRQTFETLPESKRPKESVKKVSNENSTFIESHSDIKKHLNSVPSLNDQKSTTSLPQRENKIPNINKDQDCFLKMKQQSTNIETEKTIGISEENVQTCRAGKRKCVDSDGRASKRESEDLKTIKKIKKPRPHSLLADIEQFRRSLNTILIIVVALFICYLPFMVINFLVTLQVMYISSWYELGVIIIYVHSCVSPVTLCIRIVSIREDCWRVLKKMCCCF